MFESEPIRRFRCSMRERERERERERKSQKKVFKLTMKDTANIPIGEQSRERAK